MEALTMTAFRLQVSRDFSFTHQKLMQFFQACQQIAAIILHLLNVIGLIWKLSENTNITQNSVVLLARKLVWFEIKLTELSYKAFCTKYSNLMMQ